MKRLIFIWLLPVLFISITVKSQDAKSLPYSAGYSSSFKIGSHDLSKMILELYKDYEKSDFVTKQSWFADTLIAFLPDGSMIRGKKDVTETFKKIRATEGSSAFKFDAIIPLTSTDRNEDWVALWGVEEFTTTASPSATQRMEFQAIWRVNKDKKIDFIKIFESKPAAGQQ
jgi:hypothetical protein